MNEAIAYLYLFLDIVIKFLIIAVIITWILAGIKTMKLDKQKKEEINRLKELNYGIQRLLGTPIKKARQFIEEEEKK